MSRQKKRLPQVAFFVSVHCSAPMRLSSSNSLSLCLRIPTSATKGTSHTPIRSAIYWLIYEAQVKNQLFGAPILNRILSGVRRPQNTHSGVQPAWSTPDRIGWTKPLHRGAGPTGNWNHRPRAPRHTGGANPLQADRHQGQVAPCPRLCTAAHPSTRSARGEVPPSAHARGPSRRGIHRSCRGAEQQHVAS